MDDTTSLQQLKDQVQKFCAERGWEAFHGPKDLAIGLVTEACELLEIFRFQTEEQVARMIAEPQAREKMAHELSDTLFFILRFAARFDLDLTQSFHDKMLQNERRYPAKEFFGSNRKSTHQGS